MTDTIKLPPLPEYDMCGEADAYSMDALRNYARAAVALNALKWLPMDTAPSTDGSRVLLRNSWGVDIAQWTDDRWARKPVPRWISDNNARGRRYYLNCAPTGWMPLPPLPEDAS